MQTTTEFLLNVIPASVVDAFAKGDILQVLLFSVLFGFALHKFGGRSTLVFDFVEKISHVLFGIAGTIMKIAPIGAFGAMAFTIGKYGVGSLLSLGKLMGTFYLTCLVFIFAVLGSIAALHGFSIWKFVKYIKEELFIVLAATLSAVGHVPVTGLALILGIDRFMSEARADQPDRQRCCHYCGRQMDRRARYRTHASASEQRNRARSGAAGSCVKPGRSPYAHIQESSLKAAPAPSVWIAPRIQGVQSL